MATSNITRYGVMVYDVDCDTAYNELVAAGTVPANAIVFVKETKRIIVGSEEYQYVHPTTGSAAGAVGPTINQSPSWGGTVTVPQVTVNAQGHVTAAASRVVTMPSAVATSAAAGLMSATDKAKLDKVDTATTKRSQPFFGRVPAIYTDGVMEIGTYLDFHKSNTETCDYWARVDCRNAKQGNNYYLPAEGGTVATTSYVTNRVMQEVLVESEMTGDYAEESMTDDEVAFMGMSLKRQTLELLRRVVATEATGVRFEDAATGERGGVFFETENN